MKTNEWLEWRRHGIGGTDVAKILGASEYGDAHSVWLDKRGLAPQFEGNDNTRAGTLLEPVIVKLFSDNHPDMAINNTGHTIEDGILRGTVDAIFTDVNQTPIVVEAKAPRVWSGKKWMTEGLPPDIFWQIQHYLYLAKATTGYVAFLYDDCRQYRELEVSAINTYQQVADMLRSWWQKHIVDGVEPAKPTTAGLAAGTIVADDVAKTTYVRLLEARLLANAAEAQVEELINKLKEYIDTNELLVDSSGHVLAAFRTSSRSVLDRKALAAAHPEIVKEFTSKQPIRTFLLKEPHE